MAPHWLGIVLSLFSAAAVMGQDRPNVLVCISDDQSYPHASAYGIPVIHTPGFDEVARRGTLFHNAFTPAPGCSPMRAAFLTGRYIWQNREAGTHASYFPRDLVTYPAVLEAAGYRVGATGKRWGPGNFKHTGWPDNPAGAAPNKRKMDAPQGISGNDYAANFADFLDEQSADQPFCFWFGATEPHRSFGAGLGAQSGMDPSAVEVPNFLPDTPEIRSDLLDYYFEIQWFDQHLSRMLRELERREMLDNTVIIVTSDNGMAFPRAKANLYEFGIHMPLAICWPAGFPEEQQSQALVNLIDVTATIYDVCGVEIPEQVTGNSLRDILAGQPIGERKAVFAGRERHSSSRWNSLGYPCRCVRTEDFLYIRNYAPDRWPAGAPRKYASVRYGAGDEVLDARLGPEHGGYHDIDACPSLTYLIQHREEPEVLNLLELAVAKRPSEELFHVRSDPSCIVNLVDDPEQSEKLAELRGMLTDELVRTGDLRQTDFAASHVWETYPRVSSLRWFEKPAWAKETAESGFKVPPTQDWLEARRPGRQ